MLHSGYCEALDGRTIAVVHVLDPEERERKMVLVEAAAMEQSLGETGSVSLFDKAEIKAQSEPTLTEIAKLLTDVRSLP